ncbi:MAG: hypothetical protein JXL80_04660 [Planctomycetes bacterium]|nr:hypothetical protein [Planctomycetota bacterium]
MKRILVAMVVTVPWLAGCAPSGDAWQSMVFVSTDRERAFSAAMDVLSEEYIIALSDRATGEIRTRPLMIPRRGAARRAGAYISSGDVQNVRRTVICWIDTGEGSARVRVRASLERESTNQAATLVVGSDGGDQRGAGAEPQWRYLDSSQSTYWADIGRDTQAETDLLKRIGERLNPPVPATDPPAADAAAPAANP